MIAGIVALNKAKSGRPGRGMAIAGLILGWASVAMTVLAIVAIVLFFGGLAAFVALVGANAH